MVDFNSIFWLIYLFQQRVDKLWLNSTRIVKFK